MNKSESEILEILNGLGSKKLDLDILFSFYSLELSYEIRKIIAEKIGMQEREGYFLIEKMIKKFGLKVEFIEALKLTNEKYAKDLLLKNLYQNNKLNIHIINALEPWGAEIELKLIREIFDICETEFWIAGLNILHFKAYQLTDEKLLSFIYQIKIYDNFKINYKIISILKRRESEIVCKLLYKYSLNKESEIAKYAIFSLGSIWNDNSFEQLSKLEREIRNTSLLKYVNNQKLISSQFK
ncbi:hypothetical protein OA518_00895 [Prochlorococcus sp. AH-716-F10]|nr:hypothetical protein [Prochlorococcus sp. AH-716-F10]